MPARLTGVALSLLCLVTQPAVAGGGGFYVGASAGYTLSSYRRADLDNAVVENLAGGGYTVTLTDSSDRYGQPPWSVDVGYQISSYFGLEASYLELGTLKYASSGTATSPSGPAAVNLNIRSRGPALALVGTLPLTNDWGIRARLGVYEGKDTTNFSVSVSGNSNSGSDSRTSATLLAGLGVSYVLASHCVLHLDYTHLNQLGEKVLTKSFNADLLTAGVAYAF
jgi:opacity protein-like surface antigen